MKKSKKIITYIVMLLILISISRGLIPQNNEYAVTTIKTENSLKNISYYKEKNKSRYIKYKKEFPNLSNTQIITEVNIGLDKPYYTNTKKAKNLNTILILVNKYNYLEKNYIPNELEIINSNYSNHDIKLVKEARLAFEKMAEAAAQENLNIIAMSAYRTYNYQEILYNKYVSIDGKEKADTYSARPGHSEHQTGLAVDVYNKELPYTRFEETKEYIWMQENAHKYGYILRYPKNKVKQTGYQYESWHYRYVGIDIATYISKNNITYDEYYVQNIDK